MHIGSKPPVKPEMPEARQMTITCEGDRFHLPNNFLNGIIVKVHDARRRHRQLLPILQARVVRQSMPSVLPLATPS
jgi:hypothetical protein